eukprot:767454-Hanusia_phi.AAC.2
MLSSGPPQPCRSGRGPVPGRALSLSSGRVSGAHGGVVPGQYYAAVCQYMSARWGVTSRSVQDGVGLTERLRYGTFHRRVSRYHDECFNPLRISTMKLVDHPNCVKLYDVYDDSKHNVTGGTVMDRVVEMTHFTEKDAATVTTHVLRALEHLHGLGITHRDIKPENLLYKSNDPMSPDFNTVKLADFGLAKFVGVDETMKTTCGTVGSFLSYTHFLKSRQPGYVAPEIIDPKMPFGEGYGPSVDIWSLGIVLYIMLCGFPPFLHESTAVLFQLIRKGEFDFPSPYWDAVSTDAMDLVSKMQNPDLAPNNA